MPAKKINLVLHDGTPYGVRTATVSNWNGKLIICPRSALRQLRELAAAEQPAIYFLLGEEGEVYIGETDALSSRLSSHVLQKEFWNEVLAFVSPTLTKTEVKYLEHVFAKRLKEDGVADIQNSSLPKAPTISDVDRDVLNTFVDNASDLLLGLHYDFVGVSEEVERIAKQGKVVRCVGPSADANGVYSDSGLMVRQGSLARIEHTDSFPTSAQKNRKTMLNNGLLEKHGEESYVFTKDHLFSSASAAAEVVLGRSANGLTEWKTKDGTTIKELEQEKN